MNYLNLLVGAILALMSSQYSDVKYSLQDWQEFKEEHNKSYESEAYETIRRTFFAHNKYRVEKFNEDFSEELGFELGLNHLADLSELEVKATNGFKLPEGSSLLNALKNSKKDEEFLQNIFDDDSEIPDSVDWRTVPGRVSRVKNQGQCGSCWAFASTGALEGQELVREEKRSRSLDRKCVHTITRYGQPTEYNTTCEPEVTELSEQNLVDCVKKDAGCNGGLMKDAFEFIQEEGGIDDENSYPYEARNKKCRFSKDKIAFSDSGAAMLPDGDEEKLKEVVAKFGPVAVAIDASSIWFQFYKKGVYYNKHCKNKIDQLDHGVLVVGYGTDPKKGDYWIVKNSWGPKYGEHGYIRMARNRGNNCGIATAATIPTF